MIVPRFVIVFYCGTVTELAFLIGIRSKWSRELDFHFRFRAQSDQSFKVRMLAPSLVYDLKSKQNGTIYAGLLTLNF